MGYSALLRRMSWKERERGPASLLQRKGIKHNSACYRESNAHVPPAELYKGDL